MVKAKLIIDGKEINVLWFTFGFNQGADRSGRPSQRPVFVGLKLIIETRKDLNLAEWSFSPNQTKQLELHIYPVILGGRTRKLYFYDCHLVNWKNAFSSTGSNPMSETLEITAGGMEDSNSAGVYSAYWRETFSDTVAPTVVEEPTPSIANINWIHPETKETLKETTYTENVALTAQITNQESNSATITITKEDGTEFENGQTELTFEEAITEDGIIELNSLEIKEQWQDFKTANIDKLVAKINHNGYQKKSSALKVVPPPKVLVNFRTGNGYKGEFGFDWLRMADTGKPGDVFYKDIIGSYATGSFVQSDAEYVKLGKKFEMPQHPIKANDKYVVPVLTLLPNKKATLTLKVEIKDSDAKKIEYKYDKTFFKLNKTEVSHKTVGKKELASDLTIECIKEFGTDQFIEVEADSKFAGKLKVMANDKAHRYKADIVFVEVKVNIGNGVTTGSSTGEKVLLEKYLNQALIKPNIITKPLNLTADSVLNSTYKLTIGSTVFKINDISGIHAHLRAEFNKVHSGYGNYFKVFFFNEAGGEILSTGYQGYNGAAESINSKAVVLYNTHNTSTTTHEALHAMGLYHSFSDSGDFTLEKNKTDNIMDYSHNVGINRISTWQWQWNTIYANPNVLKE